MTPLKAQSSDGCYPSEPSHSTILTGRGSPCNIQEPPIPTALLGHHICGPDEDTQDRLHLYNTHDMVRSLNLHTYNHLLSIAQVLSVKARRNSKPLHIDSQCLRQDHLTTSCLLQLRKNTRSSHRS